MNYVQSFDLFGVPAKQIPTIPRSGAPTTATEGEVGCLYMDTDTGNLYKCTAVADGIYTWVEAGNGSASDEQIALVVTEIKTILTDIATFLKAVPFDDTVVSASDLDAIQSKIDALSVGGDTGGDDTGGDTGGDDTGGGDTGDEPTETVSATFSGGVLAISGATVNSATFTGGVLAVN